MFKNNTIKLTNGFGEKNMRHNKFSVLIIALALALLLVGSAAAVSGDYKTVPEGWTVFIGEEGLNVVSCVPSSGQIEYYASGRNPSTDAPDFTYFIPDRQTFYVNPSVFSGRTGNWYRGSNTGVVAFNVQEPSMRVLIRNDNDNDITGRGVKRGELVDFRIETNLYAIKNRNPDATSFDFKIKVVNPNGVVYDSLIINSDSTKKLTSLGVNSDVWYWSGNGAQVASNTWKTAAVSGSNKEYVAGKYTIRIECNENKMLDNYNKAKSDEVTLTISADDLSISSNKDSVTRGGQFVVTIVGTPNEKYNLEIRQSDANPPTIIPNQEGVVVGKKWEYTVSTTTFAHVDAISNAAITTTNSGTRSVGFSTNSDTKARSWTIRVTTVPNYGESKYDDVSVSVKEGKLTLVVEGSGSYYLGEEITFTGTNTETETVYFFAYGPNLKSAGSSLNDASVEVKTTDPTTYKKANVRDDDTFELKWDTSNFGVDAGAYTIYAVSKPTTRGELTTVSYDTASVNFRKPYVTATVKPSNVAAGDKFHITGLAGVETKEGLYIWITGKNFFRKYTTSVDSDGTFDFEFKETSSLASGQYFVVVQHPMYDNQFNIDEGDDGNDGFIVEKLPDSTITEVRKFRFRGVGSLQGSDAANALVNAIDSSAIDDTYARLQFMVSPPVISITPVGTITIGNNFVIEGTTNIGVDNTLLVEVVSASFGPTQKTQSGAFSGFSGTTKVVAGTGEWNTFKIEVSSGNFIKDEYIITVTSIETDATSTSNFQVVEFVPTPTPTPTPIPTTPTPVPTTIATPEPTAIPTTEPTTVAPTPTPTPKSPGFGALVALIGLGVVGYLVVYRENPQ